MSISLKIQDNKSVEEQTEKIKRSQKFINTKSENFCLRKIMNITHFFLSQEICTLIGSSFYFCYKEFIELRASY